MENKKEKPTPLTPEEAIKMINGEPLDEGTTKAKGAGVKVDKEAELLSSTKEAIMLRRAEIDGKIKLEKARIAGELKGLEVNQSAKERAGKHLAVFGALYLCLLCMSFLALVYSMRNEFAEGGGSGGMIATVATLITLVISNLSAILRGITEVEERKNPTELLHDIVIRNMELEAKQGK